MDLLIDIGVCALAGCTKFIISHNFFKRYFKCIFGCSNLMLYSKSPLLGKRRKGKYSTTNSLMGKEGLKLY